MFKNAGKYCLMSTSHPNNSFAFSIIIYKNYGGFGSGHGLMTMLKKAKRSDILLTLLLDKAHFLAIFTPFSTYFPSILA